MRKYNKSREDYLEMILMLIEEKGYARNVDIATNLDFSKASVSIALKKLSSEGYLNIDDNNHINLTNKGNEIAKKTYHRHQVLEQTFLSLGVSKENSENDACQVEHYISEEAFEKIEEYLNTKKDTTK